MKPSHIRTPRTLAECCFVEGYYNTIEPSQWQGRWNSTGPVKRNYFNVHTVALGVSILVVAFVLGSILYTQL
jgi:hypothetical protein